MTGPQSQYILSSAVDQRATLTLPCYRESLNHISLQQLCGSIVALYSPLHPQPLSSSEPRPGKSH